MMINNLNNIDIVKNNNIIDTSIFSNILYHNLNEIYLYNKQNTDTNFVINVSSNLNSIKIDLSENTSNNILIIIKGVVDNLKIEVNLDRYTKANLNILQYSTNSKVDVFLNNNGMFSESYSESLVVSNNNDLNILNFTSKNNNKKTIVDTKAYGVSSNSSKVILNYVGKIINKMSGSSCHEELKGINRDNAKIEVNPILEIDEFDVTAGHGASCGNINQDILFYMQSRGLTKQMAENIFLLGFITPFFETILDTNLKEELLKEVLEKL